MHQEFLEIRGWEKNLGMAELQFCMNIAHLLISILRIIRRKNRLEISKLLSLHTFLLGRTDEGIQIYDCFIFFSGPGNELLVVVGCCALLRENV